jgi:FkbM family methyltransferase
MIDDLIFDVGMHKGEDSAFYLAKGYRVIGFEANPDLANHCRMRFADESRLTVIEGAIDDSGLSTVPFYRHAETVWGTTNSQWVARNAKFGESEAIEVPTVNFAEALQEHGVPMFMKIDVEGADSICLDSLSALSETPRYLSLESTKTDYSALQAEFTTLESLGYDRYAVVQQKSIPGSEVHTRTIDGHSLDYRFEPDSSGSFADELTRWIDRAGAEARYRRIFQEYKLWGDESLVRRSEIMNRLLDFASRRLRPLPGWYDTHAARRR